MRDFIQLTSLEDSILTLAVVQAVDCVVVGRGPGLVEGGACVAEG